VIFTFRPIYKCLYHNPFSRLNFKKFAVLFDNTYQFALVVTHTTEFFVYIRAKPLNIDKFS